MKKVFSIKYKFLITITTIPIVCILIYFSIAKSIFQKDKIAYIYESNIASANEIGYYLDQQIGEIYRIEDFYTQAKISLTDERFINQILRVKYVDAVFNTKTKKFFPSNLDGKLITPKANLKGIQKQDNYLLLPAKNSKKSLIIFFNTEAIIQKLARSPFDYLSIQNENQAELFYLGDEINFFQNIKSSQESKIGQAHLIKTQNKKEFIKTTVRTDKTGLVINSLYSWDKAMLPIRNLVDTSIYYLVIVLSISILFALLLSSKLTVGIRKMMEATKQISNENYDFELTFKSNDEMNLLKDSFLSMSQKIKKLLEELREYNLHLEDMVAQKTKELKDTLDIQTTMLNSVSQGFVVVDQNGSPLSPISTSFYQHFNINKNEKFNDIFTKYQDSYSKVSNIIFEGTLPFEDAVGLLPENIKVDSKNINFSYYPFNVDGKTDGVVMVTTDITEKLKLEKEKEEQDKKAKTIYEIVTNPEMIKSLLKGISKTIILLKEVNKNNISETFNIVHTLKAKSLMLEMTDIAKIFHNSEDILSRIRSSNTVSDEQARKLLVFSNNLEAILKEFFNEFSPYINASNVDQLDQYDYLVVNKKFWNEFNSSLSKVDESLRRKLHDVIYKKDISFVFKAYEEKIQNLSEQLNKKVIIEYKTGSEIYINKIDDLKSSLIHILTNMVFHGIETPPERLSSGKKEQGTISISSYLQGNKFFLEISDDGAGINLAKLKESLDKKGIDSKSLSESELLNSLFGEGISTAQGVNNIAGRGVGLSAVKKCVNKLEGTIKVESTLGSGTSFKIILPDNYHL